VDNSDLPVTERSTAVAAAPVLSSVVPNSGPAAGNTIVTLNGSGFMGATAVSFGAAPALAYTVNSATKITATAPPGTGTVQVSVKLPGGVTSNALPYTYVAGPTLTSVSPSQGPTAGGTTVTLTGSDFTGATAVSFGATPATSFTVNSATQITAVAPAGTGTVSVTVTTIGGTSNPISYGYLAPPFLTALLPAVGPTSAGNSVTFTGTNLTTTQAVHFAGVPAAFTVLSDSSLVAFAPPGPAGTGFVNVTTLGGTSNNIVYTRVAAPAI